MKDSVRIDQTNILPLRWFANMCGSIGGWAILRAAWRDEDKKYGRMYDFYGYVYSKTFPIYLKWGTTFMFSFDMSGKEWDDYDENGVPYWEKTGCVDPDYCPHRSDWDYEDKNTGDAFRIIK